MQLESQYCRGLLAYLTMLQVMKVLQLKTVVLMILKVDTTHEVVQNIAKYTASLHYR